MCRSRVRFLFLSPRAQNLKLLYFQLAVVFLLKQCDSTFPRRNSLSFDPWFYLKVEAAYVEFIIFFGKYFKFWDTIMYLSLGMY